MLNIRTTIKPLKHYLKAVHRSLTWAQGDTYSITPVMPMLAVTNLRDSFSKGLGIIMMLAFIFGLIKVISGAIAISNGNPDGKSAILGGMLVAGAGSVMLVLFKIFGMGAGALTPDFGF